MSCVKGRESQIRRQWKMLKIIAASRYTTYAILAKEFDCCVKTIYRDLEVLESVGFPIYRFQGEQMHQSKNATQYIRIDREWLDLHANTRTKGAA